MGLSEPKRRVKYSIDPNALRWANDESKFGKRLMEKMGWQQGEGLGAKSNGMTEHIKVKFKSDTKGVGYNNNDYDNVWLDHQDDFESVLAGLNKDTTNKDEVIEPPNKPVNSLVQKSKERSKRLHYSKFTKSKDLSMASQHDLACILGTEKRYKLKQEEQTTINESDDVKTDLCFASNPLFEPITKSKAKKETIEAESQSQQMFKTNTMSIGDYFAQKMKSKLGKIKSDENCNGNESSTSTSANETNQIPQLIEEPKKKKKKSKHSEEPIQEEEEKQIQLEIEIEKAADFTDLERKKKKKKSKNIEKDEEITKKFFEEEVVVEQQQTETKKKKKKSKDNDKVIEEDEEKTSTTTTTTTKTEIKIETSIRKDSFPGSNLFQLYGYSPYNITCNLEEIISDKTKKAAKKVKKVEKNLEKCPDFYEMSKKPSAAY